MLLNLIHGILLRVSLWCGNICDPAAIFILEHAALPEL